MSADESRGSGGDLCKRFYNPDEHLGLNSALLSGDLPAAIEICIRDGNWCEAVILAASVSPDMATRVRNRYFEACKGSDTVDIVRIFATGDCKHLVEKSDLKEWESVLTTIFAYVTDDTAIEKFVETLARRLESVGDLRSAMVCYICLGKEININECWAKLKASSISEDTAVYLSTKAAALLKKSFAAKGCKGTGIKPVLCAPNVAPPNVLLPANHMPSTQADSRRVVDGAASNQFPLPAWNGYTVPPGNFRSSGPFLIGPPCVLPPPPGNNFIIQGTNVQQPRLGSNVVMVTANPFGHPPVPFNNERFCKPNGGPNREASNHFVQVSSMPNFNGRSTGPQFSPQIPLAPQTLFTPVNHPESPKLSGFLSRLQSPKSSSNCKSSTLPGFLSRLQSPDIFQPPQTKDFSDSPISDTPLSEIYSPDATEFSPLVPSLQSKSTPSESLDLSSTVNEDITDFMSTEESALMQFLKYVKTMYCTKEDVQYDIRSDAEQILAEKIDFWNNKFSEE